MVAIVAAHAGEQNSTLVSFTNLQQAVDFIATGLESTNFVAISNACVHPTLRTTEHALKDLQKTNTRTPLRKLYSDRTFATNAATFKLGGHMSELGCIHIDFVKTNEFWMLKDIWMCK